MTRLPLSALLIFTPLCALAQATPQAATGAAALPPGPGKAIVQKVCQSCHGLEVVTAKRATPDDWAATVQLMVSRGADASDDEIDTITKYLSTSFPAVKDSKGSSSGDTAAPGSAATPTTTPSTPPSSHFDGIANHFLTPLVPVPR